MLVVMLLHAVDVVIRCKVGWWWTSTVQIRFFIAVHNIHQGIFCACVTVFL